MATKKRSRCPFPKCSRLAEHDGEHSTASPSNRRGNGGKKLFGRDIDPSVGKATQIKPGEIRNPNGAAGKTDAFSELVQEVFAENREAIKKAIRKKLVQGNLRAYGLFGDRGFGKLVQPVVGGDEGTQPIIVKMDC